MKQVVLDTDTISFFLKGIPTVVKNVENHLRAKGSISLRIITYYEILNGLLFKDARGQLARFQEFANLNIVLPPTLPIAERGAGIYAELRRRNQMIGHNDVLIGATAVENDMMLITNNLNHFSRNPGLNCATWAA